jgi:hypothetical protein
MLSWLRRHDRDTPAPAKVYIYHIDHEHDRTYAENVVEYLQGTGTDCVAIQLRNDGFRPELELCLEERPSVALGFNTTLDHSWLSSGRFLAAAEDAAVPVLQWIVDHPSARWPEFDASTAGNSRYLLNTREECRFFETYCLPGAMTAPMGGVGPNRRSRVTRLAPETFLPRRFACMIPLNLHRVRSMAENDAAMDALAAPLARAARDAIASARFDLVGTLDGHVSAALGAGTGEVPCAAFNALCHVVEQEVQTARRLKIFAVAKKYPALIQSDESAAPHVAGGIARLETGVGMQYTLARMPICRSVLSVSPMNGMIHDRTMNALNAGCVAILEDSPTSRAVLEHGKNALLFRYDDDSIAECLHIVCHQPDRAYAIAQAGLKLRDDPRLRFGGFHNLLALARRKANDGARPR